MTDQEKRNKEAMVVKLRRLSKHYALTDEQVDILNEAADIINKDIREIVGLMAMSRGMMNDLGEQRVGEIFEEVFGRSAYR